MNKTLKKILAIVIAALGLVSVAVAENVSTPSDLTAMLAQFVIATPTNLNMPTEAPEPEGQLNPNRTIDIYADWGGGILYFGDEAILTAVLTGYENAVYTLQWQMSVDNINWVDVDGETDYTMHIIVTEENYTNYWRIEVTITDII